MWEKKAPRIPIEPFCWESHDPLAAEHELVAALVSETLKSNWYPGKKLDLDAFDAWRRMLALPAQAQAAVVLALATRAKYLDDQVKRVKALAAKEWGSTEYYHLPEWEMVWPGWLICAEALSQIMRRKLPLGRQHLMALADWMASEGANLCRFYPIKPFIKAVVAYGQMGEQEEPLRQLLARLSRALRADVSKEAPKMAQQLEEMLGIVSRSVPAANTPPEPREPQGLRTPRQRRRWVRPPFSIR